MILTEQNYILNLSYVKIGLRKTFIFGLISPNHSPEAPKNRKNKMFIRLREL